MFMQNHGSKHAGTLKHALFMGFLISAGAISACGATAPKELQDARAAYEQAQRGPAARSNPAQLHTAEQSLKLAEKTFEQEGGSDRTRDRAYVALRKVQLAETQARIAAAQRELQAMTERQEKNQVAQLEQSKTDLATSEQGRKDAEAKAAASALELARLANVKQEPRGMVITLSGSVLFASGKSELLPAAQRRLSEVARALKEQPNASQILVEGHTDAKGAATYNLELSARRAEAVRSYLISEGIPDSSIRAAGLGLTRPVSDNKSAEGRANNRRVEIVVEPPQRGAASTQGS